jgi:hypothetical protein
MENQEAPEIQNANKLLPQASAYLRFVKSIYSMFVKDSSTGAAITHFMILHNMAFVRFRILLSVQNGGASGYLKMLFSPAWEKRCEVLDNLLAEAASKSKAAKVPVVLIELPSLNQATLLRMKDLPVGVDPHAFNERLKQIAWLHGMQFVDGLEAFRGEPEANTLYYVVDGHMNEKGHAFISRALVEQLTKEQGAALLGRNDTQRKTAVEQRR